MYALVLAFSSLRVLPPVKTWRIGEGLVCHIRKTFSYFVYFYELFSCSFFLLCQSGFESLFGTLGRLDLDGG